MNPGEFLIAAVYQVASAAVFAIAAGASKEANANALPNYPALCIGPERVDSTDGFMAGHSWPVDWKQTVNGPGIRMAYAASLDAYPYFARPRIVHGLPHELKPPWSHSLYGLIRRHAFHHAPPSTNPVSSRHDARCEVRAIV